MTKTELQAKIAKLEKNKFVPEKLKEKQLKKLRAELAGMEDKADKKPEQKPAGNIDKKWKSIYDLVGRSVHKLPNAGGYDRIIQVKKHFGDNVQVYFDGGSDEIKDILIDHETNNAEAIFEHKHPSSSAVSYTVSELLKIAAGKMIKTKWDDEIQLDSVWRATPEKKSKKQSKKSAKTAAPKKPAAKKSKVKAGKSYKAGDRYIDDMTCEELEAFYVARKAKQAKSEKKSKTRPIMEKIVNNVANATKHAIENVAAEDIKKNPKKFIDKFEKAEKAGEAFVASLKDILGEDYDKSEVHEGMEKVIILIKGLKEKYAK